MFAKRKAFFSFAKRKAFPFLLQRRRAFFFLCRKKSFLFHSSKEQGSSFRRVLEEAMEVSSFWAYSCCCLIWDSRQLQRDSSQSQWTSSARKKYEIIFILHPAMYINRQITWAVSTCERTRRTRTFGIPCSSKSPHSDCNICSSFLFEAQLFVRAFHLKKFSCSFKGYALFFLS